MYFIIKLKKDYFKSKCEKPILYTYSIALCYYIHGLQENNKIRLCTIYKVGNCL